MMKIPRPLVAEIAYILKKIPKPSAAQITHILKVIGCGRMDRGLGVIAAGSATAGVIATMIANKVIRDRELIELAEKLKQANELYEAARRVTKQQKAEIEELNKKIGEILQSQKKDQEQLESLKARLNVLIEQLQRSSEV